MTTEYLLNQELGHVLAALTPQNALIMEAVLQTGLRISDVLELKTEQLRVRFYSETAIQGRRRCIESSGSKLLTSSTDNISHNEEKYIRYPNGYGSMRSCRFTRVMLARRQ